jgi:polyphosphate kinase
MPRNLDTRVELSRPVEEPELKRDLMDVLGRSLADDSNAWELQHDGTWRAASRGPSRARSSAS